MCLVLTPPAVVCVKRLLNCSIQREAYCCMSVHQCNEFRINGPRPTAVKVNKDPLRCAEITSHPPIKDSKSNQETVLLEENTVACHICVAQGRRRQCCITLLSFFAVVSTSRASVHALSLVSFLDKNVLINKNRADIPPPLPSRGCQRHRENRDVRVRTADFDIA